MSLLMDALKRAEEAKRQGTQPRSENDGGLSLEPRSGEPSPLPDLSSHIESVDADLQAEAAGQAPAPLRNADLSVDSLQAPIAAGQLREREAARQVFAAKQGAADSPSRKSNILVILGVGSVVGIAVAGYFWYQIGQISGGPGLGLGAQSTAVKARTAPPAPIVSSQASSTAPIVNAMPQATQAPPTSEPVTRGWQPEPRASTRQTAVSASASGERNTRRSKPVVSTPGTQAQQIAVTFGTSPIDAALAMGYSAMNRGDLDAASIAYQEVLRANPQQVDAMLGLSAIAANRGNTDQAAAGYFRVLEIDPRNASAHVGLLGLGAAGDINQRESRLRSLLSQQVAGSYEAGMLHFGLGNLYASQRRWSDAQQSFFSAHASDSGNPDYLYNLAVSLDHLQKRDLALRYYESAGTAASARAASFDVKDLEARIGELTHR